MSLRMKNGALTANALHLFLTQLEPEVKLLRLRDFWTAAIMILIVRNSNNPGVAFFFLLHTKNIFCLLPPTSIMLLPAIKLIIHFTHGTYQWVKPHYKYSFLYSCTQWFPEGSKRKWLIWLAFASSGTAADLARVFSLCWADGSGCTESLLQ